MTKNKFHMTILAIEIQKNLDMMSQLEPDNLAIQAIVQSGFEIVKVFLEKIDADWAIHTYR